MRNYGLHARNRELEDARDASTFVVAVILASVIFSIGLLYFGAL